MENLLTQLGDRKRLTQNVLLLSTLLLFICLSFQSSISGDEDIHMKYGERVLNYFTSGGEDRSYRDEIRGPDYAYNYTIDVIVELVQRVTGVEDIHWLRHIFNSIAGWLIILFASLIALRYFGLPTFILTVIFLCISPRFVGHSMNNPKDIPFALGYILGLYYIFKFCDELPKVSWKSAVQVGLAIGICLNFRIGGLLLIPYFGLFVIYRLLLRRGFKAFSGSYVKEYVSIFFKGLVACVIAYILMIVTWPFALEAPLKNPMKALDIMSNFAIGIRQLFEGQNVTSTRLPSNYIYKWMYMTIPIVVLLGLLILPFSFYRFRTKKRFFVLSSLAFAVVFPIAYAIAKSSNVYGAWRHFIFVYPPLILLSAAGYRYFLKHMSTRNRVFQYVLFGAIIVLCIKPVMHIYKNHPVEYVYFNELSGGINKAYGNYEMDYYMHSIKPAITWMEKEGIINDQDSITIASNHSYSTTYYNRKRKNIRNIYTRYYERLNSEWDYAVYVNTYIDQAELKNKMFPPSGTIHTIDVDGRPMCAIVKKPSNSSVGYLDDMKNNRLERARQKLTQYYNVDKNNFEANINLAIIHQNLSQTDRLRYFLTEAQRVNPQRYSRYVKQ